MYLPEITTLNAIMIRCISKQSAVAEKVYIGGGGEMGSQP